MLKEIIGSNLHDIGVAEDFLNNTEFTQKLRLTIDKWTLTKLKFFCTAKENQPDEEEAHIMGHNIWQVYIWQSFNAPKYIKISKNSNKQK